MTLTLKGECTVYMVIGLSKDDGSLKQAFTQRKDYADSLVHRWEEEGGSVLLRHTPLAHHHLERIGTIVEEIDFTYDENGITLVIVRYA